MSKQLKESAMLGLTAARLWQAVDLSKRILANRSTFGATAAICAVDLGDGILARKLSAEGPKRRALDSAVDATIITAGLLSTFKMRPKARPYIGTLIAREAFVGGGWALDLLATKQVKKGDDFHKLPSLSIAAFCLAANHGSERSMKITGIAAIAINGMLAFDYYKGWREPARTTMLDNGVVEVPGFYDARVAATRLAQVLPQLGLSGPQPLLEQSTSGEAIDSGRSDYIKLPPEAA